MEEKWEKVRDKMKCMKDRRKMRKYYDKFIIKLREKWEKMKKSEKSDEMYER